MKELEYFKNFDEGDNITVTCDFYMNALAVEEHIIEQNKTINRLEEEKEILMKTLKVLIKEIDL